MIIRRKLASFLAKLVNKLDNNNNIDFNSNGERFFLECFGEYERQKKAQRSVVFDVGANQGEWTGVAERLVSNVDFHLFEPSTAAFKCLMSRYNSESHIFLTNAACSDVSGQGMLYSDFDGSTLASLTKRDLSLYDIEMNKSEEIECITLSDYIVSNRIGHIDLLKVDVEGHEYNVLEGLGEYLNPDFIDLIQFEYGGTNVDSRILLKDIFETLTNSGFKIGKLYPKGVYFSNYRNEFENFQYSNWIVVSPKIDFGI